MDSISQPEQSAMSDTQDDEQAPATISGSQEQEAETPAPTSDADSAALESSEPPVVEEVSEDATVKSQVGTLVSIEEDPIVYTKKHLLGDTNFDSYNEDQVWRVIPSYSDEFFSKQYKNAVE